MKSAVVLLIALLLSTQATLEIAAQAQVGGQSPEVPPAVDVKAAVPAARRVLALYWYPSDHPVSVTFDRQFQAILTRESASTVERFAEYFESFRFPGESQAQIMRDFLHQKYADRKPDVLFAWGPVPLEFLLKYRRDLFPDTPIVFYVGTLEAVKEYSEPGLTGITNPDAYEKTLELALSLHPDTKAAYIISGTPTRDKLIEREASQQLARFRGRVRISYLTDVPLDQLIATVKSLPKGSVILYSRQSQEDPGRVLQQTDFLDMISRSASAPVYSPWRSLVGYGTTGGVVDDPVAGATKAAEIVLRIVRGARPEDIPIDHVPKIPTFDARQLNRWNINESRLPAGSVVLFREPTLWSQYRYYVVATGVVVAVQALLISGLLVQGARRRRSEDALRESERRYALATVAGSVGVWDWTLATNEVWIDPALKRALGFTVEEIGNRLESWLEHVHPDDVNRLVLDARALVHLNISSFENEHRMMHRDGSIRWFLTRGSAVRNPDGYALRVIGTDTDITDRKSTEIQLEETRHELARVARVTTLAQFASAVAHETSQPLNTILLNARACLRWLGRSTLSVDQLRTTLQDITQAAKQANDVITRHRGMVSRRPVEKQTLDMNGLVRDVVTLARTRSHQSRVIIETTFDQHLAPVLVDRVEIQQVLLNLLLNGIEAVEAANPPSRLIHVQTRRSGETLIQVSVRDSGIGLRGVDRDGLFAAFYTTKASGTGVGLSISRYIVEDHGGRLWAEGHDGPGATFTFTLPVAVPINPGIDQRTGMSVH